MQRDLTPRDALFLDLNGSLIDIAATPDSVSIPAGFVTLVDLLVQRLGGALAILTGRPIKDVDRLFSPLAPVAAGVHGAELRFAPQGEIVFRAPPIDAEVARSVHRVAEKLTGVLVEAKHASIAVHYRQAPVCASLLEAALARILEDGPDHLILAHGRQVLEIVPRHISKGTALEAIMHLPAFRERRPVMIGDDLPDLSAMEAAVRLGGSGLKVAGEQFSAIEADFAGPAEVRTWLRAMTTRLTS